LQHRDSSVNIPLPLDQHHISGVASGRKGADWLQDRLQNDLECVEWDVKP